MGQVPETTEAASAREAGPRPEASATPGASQEATRNVGLGLYADAGKPGLNPAEIIAIVLSLLWLTGCAVFFLVMGGNGAGAGEAGGADPFRLVMTLLAVFMPVAVIWVAAAATRSARIMREESQRLHVAIDAIRHSYLQQQQSGVLGRQASSVERKLDALAQAQRKTETALAMFSSSRHAALPEPPRVISPPRAEASDETEQPALALGTSAEELAPPMSNTDVIRALHFPEDADDKEGFEALRRALQDHRLSGLIRAAQDVLTLLSQDGIYMDDLRPDMPRPEVWRKFAEGKRGRAVAALGGIRDRSSLALTAGRMRSDPVFRDAAHHFLRKFDQVVSDFAPNATDQELAELAETRSARAFMLLGRVTGTFD